MRTRRNALHWNYRRSSVFLALFFRVLPTQGQPKDRGLADPGDISPRGFLRVWQIERAAMLATVDFCLLAKRLFDVTAGALQHVSHVEPALQMPTAQFAFLVLLVAGALKGFFILHFVLGKLGSFSKGVGHVGSIAREGDSRNIGTLKK